MRYIIQVLVATLAAGILSAINDTASYDQVLTIALVAMCLSDINDIHQKLKAK